MKSQKELSKDEHLNCPNCKIDLKYYDTIRYYDGFTDTLSFDDIYICPICNYRKVK